MLVAPRSLADSPERNIHRTDSSASIRVFSLKHQLTLFPSRLCIPQAIQYSLVLSEGCVHHVHTMYQYLPYIENGMRGESGQPGIGLLWVDGQLAFVMALLT